MRKELGLKERLIRYMQKNHQTTFISSGELQKVVMAHSNHTARSAVRRLQELFEDGQLDRELRKGHAWYKAKDKAQTAKHNLSACVGCAQHKLALANW